MRSLYYIFNLFIALSGIVGWRVFKRNVSFSLKRFLPVVLYVSLPFVLWDVWAANEGHWAFSDRFIFGPYIAGIPLEEILFFVTVPLAMCIVWESVSGRIAEKRLRYDDRALWVVLSIAGIVMLIINWDRGYTRSALLGYLVVNTFLYVFRYLKSKHFAVFSLIHLVVFFVSNTVLTSLPVITYGEGSYIGYRIGTIPIEDFFFSYALINLALLAYNRKRI